MDRCVRGAVILGYLKFIKKTWGIQGVSDCLKATKIDPDRIKEGVWYPIDIDKQIMDWIVDTKGPDYLPKCGHFTIQDLGWLSFVVRFLDIKTIIKKMPASYKEAYNFGEIIIADLQKRSAVIQMKDCIVDENTCITWWGAMNGALEMTNTKGAVMEVQCQNQGAECCEFVVKWE